MDDDQTLNLLDERIKKLEQTLYGSASREGSYPEIVSSLTDLSTELGNTLSTRDRMMAVMKRLEELDEYLDPCYGACASNLPQGALMDLLLCQEEEWQQQYQHLQRLGQLRMVLDSQPIRECVSMSDELVQLSCQHTELEGLEHDQAKHITNLLHSYNSIIQTLTETFVKMDTIVTRAEAAALTKKPID